MKSQAHALISGACPEFAIRIVEKLEQDLAAMQRERDDWRTKHWKAHDDSQRIFKTWSDRALKAEAALELIAGPNAKDAKVCREIAMDAIDAMKASHAPVPQA